MGTDTVVAEYAPLGVLLWPVRGPEHEDSFTLTRVDLVRSEARPEGYVQWTYRSGTTRVFEFGERVAVKWPEGYDALDLKPLGGE